MLIGCVKWAMSIAGSLTVTQMNEARQENTSRITRHSAFALDDVEYSPPIINMAEFKYTNFIFKLIHVPWSESTYV